MKAMAFFLSMGLATSVSAETIRFTTEDYPPYNYRQGNGYTGAGYKQVIELMKYVEADYTVELMPWARAFALAEAEANTCVFTTAHIPERNDRFKWVEPLAIDRNFMIARKESGVEVANDEQAKRYVVGTQRDDYTQDLLERNGFPKIDLATDLDLTLKKLVAGRIDLMPISEKFYMKLKKEGKPVEAQYVFSRQTFSIACNINFPEQLHRTMQEALNRIMADGTQARLLQEEGLGPLGATSNELSKQ
ncbi:MAG: ABC transporter substrate-binding protein [Shinella sp.]|nr:MAG: ABC transporter substrate-binding protein [Shinella sp.]